MMDSIKWMAVLAVIVGFVYAFGIGANDVANSFASSVAAKSLTLAQAIVVASIAEFLGAILLGTSVTGTVRGSIIKTDQFSDQPELFAYGMLNSLIFGSVWLLTATHYEFPVSTTHVIIASIMGFSIVSAGFDSVNWITARNIFLSWLGAPSLSGTISYCFFYVTKKFVLECDNSFERASFTFPLVVFVGITVNVAFIMLKSAKKIKEWHEFDDFGHQVALPAAFIGGLVCAVLTYFCMPLIKKRVQKQQDEYDDDMAKYEAEQKKIKDLEADSDENTPDADKEEDAAEEDTDFKNNALLKDPVSGTRSKNTKSLHMAHDAFEAEEEENKSSNPFHRAWNFFADNTYRQDLQEQSFDSNKRAREIWSNSTLHDMKTERLFMYVQVFTACLASFSHGSNDVANAIGPLVAVLQVYKDGEINSKSDVPMWVLCLGGAGLALGFTLFGYKIIRAVGYKLTCISPSRGFCIELATSLAVSTASYLHLPVSSTQCLVGATVGAGFAAGGASQVQWLYFLRISCGWVGVFFIALFCSAGTFAYCAFGPSVATFPIVSAE